MSASCEAPASPQTGSHGTSGRTHLVADARVGGRHGGVEHVHLLQLHVAVELLQLGGLHALQLREVVLGEVLELAVHVVRVEVPVMVCRDGRAAWRETRARGAGTGYHDLKNNDVRPCGAMTTGWAGLQADIQHLTLHLVVYHPHFVEEDPEAWQGHVTCPRVEAPSMAEPRPRPEAKPAFPAADPSCQGHGSWLCRLLSV